MDHYGIVTAVAPESPADLAGLATGDRLVSVNGHFIRDIIDYRFHTAESVLDLTVLRGERPMHVHVEKDIDEPLGLEFDEELFDGVITCDNSCVFCFVHQLPRGMRRTLYLRDDDYRLSFLHGNFVTLTTTSEADIRRIVEQRLSPMYVSVHATDERLRRELLHNPDAPEIMPQLQALARGGITLHTQIVLCPGRNDGPQLDKTLCDLASLYPAVRSIAVVPVGLTKHRRRREPIRAVDTACAAAVLAQVRQRQREFRRTLGSRLVHASDEMYLLAGAPVPRSRDYEGFPQLENGVGLLRKFLDGAARTLARFPKALERPVHASLITGTSAAPFLRRFAQALNQVPGVELKVEVVENNFFGPTVTVAGLLTGQDVISQLRTRQLAGVAILPSVCLRDGVFLDDIPVEHVQQELEIPVHAVEPSAKALAAKILEISRTQRPKRLRSGRLGSAIAL